ncbi:uncharacterized protein [Argopecten irradians]|uniref:uncharacterized protein n=1 Tax=Argopecten irradians TaxID=31199 RepID=UPI00371B7634
MFYKHFCRPFLQHNNKCIHKVLHQMKHSGRHRLNDILDNPGPKSKLPTAMYQEFKDMDPEMQKKFKRIVQCEFKLLRMEQMYPIDDILTKEMWTQLYHTRVWHERNSLMQKFCDEKISQYIVECRKREKHTANVTESATMQSRVSPKVDGTKSGTINSAKSGTIDSANSGINNSAKSGTINSANSGTNDSAKSRTIDSAKSQIIDSAKIQAVDSSPSPTTDSTKTAECVMFDTDKTQENKNKESPCVYGVSYKTQSHYQTQRQIYSRKFGLDLIIDLKDVHTMNKKQQIDVLKSVHWGLQINSRAQDPFRMVLCNSELKETSLQEDGYNFSNYFEDFTDKSYVDLFPRKTLVYLSPSAKPSRVQFDPQITYIIGGLPSTEHLDISLARAKRDNIRVQEIPLRNFLSHVQTRRSLPINEVLMIMHGLKDNDGNYHEALRNLFRKPNSINLLSAALKGFKKPPQTGKNVSLDENYIDLLLRGRPLRSINNSFPGSSWRNGL